VTQVVRRVIRLKLVVKRICGTYANGKRRKRGEDTSPLSLLNPRSQISAPHDPDTRFPAFASKTPPDFPLNEFSVPYLASVRFLSFAEPFTMDEFEAALDLCCNNSSPGMDGIKFNI
jgi:hypothetical protein